MFSVELNTALQSTGLPVQLGYYSDTAPDKYIVFTPMNDRFTLWGDDDCCSVICDARISLFVKGEDYTPYRVELILALKDADFIVLSAQYIGIDYVSGYHHYSIDCEKLYNFEEEFPNGNNRT